MIIWLLTAAAALIVTVVYFGELQKLYSAASSIEEAGKNGAGTLVADLGGKNTSGQGAKHEDAGNSDGAEAGEKADNPGKSDTGNSGDGKSSASISVPLRRNRRPHRPEIRMRKLLLLRKRLHRSQHRNRSLPQRKMIRSIRIIMIRHLIRISPLLRFLSMTDPACTQKGYLRLWINTERKQPFSWSDTT